MAPTIILLLSDRFQDGLIVLADFISACLQFIPEPIIFFLFCYSILKMLKHCLLFMLRSFKAAEKDVGTSAE